MSTETKQVRFTPGPWSVGYARKRTMGGGGPDYHEVAVHVGEGGSRGNCLAVAHLGGGGACYGDLASVEANAHLIAAAPDLYEALASLVGHIQSNEELARLVHADYWLAAKAALAKARGEG